MPTCTKCGNNFDWEEDLAEHACSGTWPGAQPDGKIVGLHGPIAPRGTQQVHQGSLDVARQLIADVESGEIVGLAIVAVHKIGDVHETRSSWVGPKFQLMAGLTRATYAMNVSWDREHG